MDTEARLKIAFFEVDEWERSHFANRLAAHDLLFFHEALDEHHLPQVAEADVISVFIHSLVTRDLLDRLPNLRFIATRSTGFDHIDLAAVRERGIGVSNVPFYGENTVAEHAFGLMLAISRNIHRAQLRTTRGDFSLPGLLGFDLKGRTLGVVGAGSIGLHVIRIAKGFGMNVLAFDVRQNRLLAEVLGFEYAEFEDLLRRSDIISLHAPYTEQTHHLINRETIRLIKPGAVLINTARGGLVDTDALIEALDEGILSGAGLDVLEGEELIKEERQILRSVAVEDKLKALLRSNLLTRREDVVVTPHIGFYSREALQRIIETTVANITGFLEGQPQNVVTPAVAPIQRDQRAA